MILKHALKTAIAAGILAELARYLNLQHLQYPVFGLVATMLSANLGDTLKAGWGRLGGSTVAGLVSAFLISSFGSSPVVGGLAFILATLGCELLQRPVMTTQAGMITAMIFSDSALNDQPWIYAFNRVLDNSLGVLVAVVVTYLFWPDNPRQALRNNFTEFLNQSNQLLQQLTGSVWQTEPLGRNFDQQLRQMSDRLNQSETLLNKSLYGFSGRQLVADNWSDRLLRGRNLYRHLLTLAHLFRREHPNPLLHDLATDLAQVQQQVSQLSASAVAALHIGTPLAVESIPALETNWQRLADKISHLRSTGAIRTYPVATTFNAYGCLHLLRRFTQELQQLSLTLWQSSSQTVPKPEKAPRLIKPLPVKQYKHILKTGLAVGLTLAIIDWAKLPFGYYVALALVVAMQPTLGKTLQATRQRMVCTAIAAVIALVLILTLGGNPFTLALGIGLVVYLCSAIGFAQGYTPGCFLMANCMMIFTATPVHYVWSRFLETCLGLGIALVAARLIWPETAQSSLESSIGKTFTQLGQLQELIVRHYLHGEDTQTATVALEQEIRRALQSQSLLQAQAQMEYLEAFAVSRIQRRWNFLIGYEKTLLSNILLLRQSVESPINHDLLQLLTIPSQDLTAQIAQTLKQLAPAVSSHPKPEHFLKLERADRALAEAFEQLRSSGSTLKHELQETIAYFGFISELQEITANLLQMAKDWPA